MIRYLTQQHLSIDDDVPVVRARVQVIGSISNKYVVLGGQTASTTIHQRGTTIRVMARIQKRLFPFVFSATAAASDRHYYYYYYYKTLGTYLRCTNRARRTRLTSSRRSLQNPNLTFAARRVSDNNKGRYITFAATAPPPHTYKHARTRTEFGLPHEVHTSSNNKLLSPLYPKHFFSNVYTRLEPPFLTC